MESNIRKIQEIEFKLDLLEQQVSEIAKILYALKEQLETITSIHG